MFSKLEDSKKRLAHVLFQLCCCSVPILILASLCAQTVLAAEAQATSSKERVSYTGLIEQAFRDNLSPGDKNDILVFVPEILKVRRQADQIQLLAYVSYAQLKIHADGRYYPKLTFTTPLEFYSSVNPSTGQRQSFYSMVLPPEKFDPETWSSMGITEASFDPESLLKAKLQKVLTPSERVYALSFLEEEPAFSYSIWDMLIGKPLSEAGAQEIQAAMKEKQAQAAFARQKACALYAKQYCKDLVPSKR